jgi:hypothetical protein
LRSGNIFFVHIDIHSLNEEDDFLDFFVKFWCKLVASVIDLRNDYPLIKLVAVIAVRGLVPECCLKPSLICTLEEFDGKKMLKLPLEKWTKDDIYIWLLQHSRLDSIFDINKKDIQLMANNIYQSTDGTPSQVRNELLEILNNKFG